MAAQNPFDDMNFGSELLQSAQNPFDDPEFGAEKSEGFLGHAKNLGLSLAKGVIAVPEAAVGLADIATGGRAGKFLENEGGAFGFRPEQAKAFLSDQHTDGYKEQQRQFQEADGIGGKFKAAIENPSLVANTVFESLAPMGGGAVLARGMLGLGARGVAASAGGVGPVMPGALARMAGADAAPLIAGAVGEGTMMAGGAAEQIRQQTEDGLLTPGQTGAAAATGVIGGAFGYGGAKIASKLGIGDVDTMLAQGATRAAGQASSKSIPRQVVEGAMSEGLLEELPQTVSEQLLQNFALDKPWDDGLDAAIVMGTLAGMGMGGAAAGVSGWSGRGEQQRITQEEMALKQAEIERRVAALPDGAGALAQQRAAQEQEADEADVEQTTPPDGTAIVAQQQAQAARDAEIAASRAVETPDDEILQSTGAALRPSEAMGLRSGPEAGSLENAAALSVDTGATAQLQQAAAQAQAAEAAKKGKPANQKQEQPAQAQQEVDQDTGEISGIPTMSDWSDADLSTAFRNAQSKDVRLQLANELSRRRAAREEAALQAELQANQAAADMPDAPDSAFARVQDGQGIAPAQDLAGQTQDAQEEQTQEQADEFDPFAQWQKDIDAAAAQELTEPAPPAAMPVPGNFNGTPSASMGARTDASAGPGFGPRDLKSAIAKIRAQKQQAAQEQPTTPAQQGFTDGTQADQTQQGSAQPAQTQPADTPGAVARHPTWRQNAIQAGRVARELGLAPKGKRLAQIVAEVDAHDAAQNQAVAPATQAQEAIENVADSRPENIAVKALKISEWTDRETAPIGTWVKADYKLADSQPIYQVRELPLDSLYLPETIKDGRLQPEKRSYVNGYADRLRAGEAAPGISVVEMEDGRMRVVDGHRRVMAARAAGRGAIRALVSPLIDTPGGKQEATSELLQAAQMPQALTSYTPADIEAQQQAQEQAAKAEAAAKRAEDAAATEADNRKRIAAASVAAADSFELGQDPTDNLTGQKDVFADAPVSTAPAQPAAEVAPQPPAAQSPKQAKAIERVNAGKAFFFSQDKAGEFIAKNDLAATHEVVQENRAFHVKAKAAQPVAANSEANQTAAPADTAPTATDSGANAIGKRLQDRIAADVEKMGGKIIGQNADGLDIREDDRNTFTLERLNEATGKMEPVTFKRGETVKLEIGQRPFKTATITGISHADRKFKVDGRDLGHDFGYAYKADFDEMARPKAEVDNTLNQMEQRLNEGVGIQSDGFFASANATIERNNLGDYAKDRMAQLDKKAAEVSKSVADKARAAEAEKDAKEAKARAEEKAKAAIPAQPVDMTMEEWKATSKDFKGAIDGQRMVMRDGAMRPVNIVKAEAKPASTAPAEPNPLEHTPKQYADAWLRWSAETNGLPLAEVREMEGDAAGLKNIEQRWVDAVIQEARNGKPLPARSIDKLLEVRPSTTLPESAIPDGYQRPEARKAEKEEAAARKSKPTNLKEGIAAARAKKAGPLVMAKPNQTAMPGTPAQSSTGLAAEETVAAKSPAPAASGKTLARSLAEKQVGERIELSQEDKEVRLINSMANAQDAYITQDGKELHVAEVVANENLKKASTEAIQSALQGRPAGSERAKRLQAELDSRGAAAAKPAPAKRKLPPKLAAKAAEVEAQRAAYFAPGNVVTSYAGNDRVVAYTPADAQGNWSVTVQAVQKQGNDWVNAPGKKEHTHSTQPDARALKAGPVVVAKANQATTPVQQAQAATNSGADAQGKGVMFSRAGGGNTEAAVQLKETERAYGGREAYNQAKAAGKTKLTYGQWVQVRTPKFKAWFGDWEGASEKASKVVDPATGEPLVVYHGTRADFNEFSRAFDGDGVGGEARSGFFFTSDPDEASDYAAGSAPGGRVMPVYVAMKRPTVFEFADHGISDIIEADGEVAAMLRKSQSILARLKGSDGLILKDINGIKGKHLVIAFRPEQIKSATGNNGNFDPDNADIRYSNEMSPDLARAILALGRPPARATKESVRAAVRELVNGLGLLPNRLGRVVVATAAEIKQEWEPLIGPTGMEASGSAGHAQGFYDPKSKTVFLIADHIKAGDELGVAAHELMHKHGPAVLGQENWDKLHSAIGGWAKAKAGSMERIVYDEAARRVQASDPELSTQELFPYAVQVALEMGVRPNALAAQGTVARWLGQVRAALRTVWEKITRKPDSFKSQDLVNLAFGIAQRENPAYAGGLDGAVAQGDATGAGQSGGVQFSRAADIQSSMGTMTNLKERAGWKLTDWLGMGLQALGRRQLVDIYGDVLPLDQYNKLAAQMEADKNEVGAGADQLATAWGKLKDERQLAELMHEATLAQIDPEKAHVAGDDRARYQMLRGRFAALTPEAKKVYQDARGAYKDHHANVRNAIKERIERSELKGERKAEMLKRMDDEFFKSVKGVYFPLARFGRYVVAVKGADGKVQSVGRAETKPEAEALRRTMLTAFPQSQGYKVDRVILSKEFIATRDSVGRGFMTELYQVLDKQDMDAAQRAELEDTLGQLYLSALPDLSWAKHGIHRKGTPGFSQDARRAYAQNMFHGARYLAKLRYSDLMQDELAAMQEHTDNWKDVDGFNQNNAQRVVDEFNKRHESLMNPKGNPVSTALTSLGFVFYLGLSPASAMVNLSQTALVAYPVMGAKWGFGKASAALLKASEQALKGKNDITASLTADERLAYDEAVRSGTIDVTMAHDLAGIAQGEDAGVMWKIRPVMKAASFLFHHAERFNRQVTFVAAYRLAREAGSAHGAALEQATKATYDGHFDYSSGNRPRIMQGNVAKVVTLFKQYGQNMVYTLSRNAYQSVQGTEMEKKEARKVLAALLVSHGMAAGALGLPMVTTLLAAASMLGGDDDEPWDAKVALQNLLADTFGQKTAEVMAHGLSRLTPWDISGRVGLDRLILPDVQEGLEGQRLGEAAMTAALGPVAGIGVNMLKGLQEISEGQFERGLESMLPTALRGPLKAVRYANEGVQDKSGISILDEVSTAGTIGQVMGFSPSEARNAQEGKSAVMAHDRALGERRSELLGQFARAAMDKDADGQKDARAEIAQFNAKHPGRAIKVNHMMASVRGRQKRIDQAQDGVYLPKNRRDALEAGRFALVKSD